MRNPYLCIMIVCFLGMGAVGGMVGLIVLAYSGKPPPESLVAAVALCFGSLSSFLVSPPRGSIGINSTQNGTVTRTTSTETHIEPKPPV